MKNYENVNILTVYPEESNKDDFLDLITYLGADTVANLEWWLKYLDCIGPKAQSFCEKVNQGAGLFVPGHYLLEVATDFEQVLEGTFIGMKYKFDKNGKWLEKFPEMEAQITIEVIDGSFFDIYLYDENLLQLIEDKYSNIIENNVDDYLTYKAR